MPKTAIAIRHLPFEDLGILHPVLAAHGYETSYLDAGIDSVTPEVVLGVDLVVVLGGPIGVYETVEYPFLLEEKHSLAARINAGLPTLGVCLGAQLIADVMGGNVRPTGKKEIGYSPLTLTKEGRRSILAPLADVPVLHWHGDEFSIPVGAERLAETPGFPNQAFAFGQHILGLQFHLEADHTQIERWLIGHACELAGAGISPETIRHDAQERGPALAMAASRVFNDWLDQLR